MAELFSGKMLWRFFGPHNRRLDELGTSAGHRFLIEHHILSSIRELQHTSNILSVIFEWKSWCLTASKISSRFVLCWSQNSLGSCIWKKPDITNCEYLDTFSKVKDESVNFCDQKSLDTYLINNGKVVLIFFSKNFHEDSFQR